MNEASYTAWDDNLYEWPPPDGWYQADDGKWWPQGYGPNGALDLRGNGDDDSNALLFEVERTSIFPAGGSGLVGSSNEDRLALESQRPIYEELPNIDDVFGDSSDDVDRSPRFEGPPPSIDDLPGLSDGDLDANANDLHDDDRAEAYVVDVDDGIAVVDNGTFTEDAVDGDGFEHFHAIDEHGEPYLDGEGHYDELETPVAVGAVEYTDAETLANEPVGEFGGVELEYDELADDEHHLVDVHDDDEHHLEDHELVDDHAVDDHAVDDHAVDDHAVDDQGVDDHHLEDHELVNDHHLDDHELVDDHGVDDHELVDDHAVDDRDLVEEAMDDVGGRVGYAADYEDTADEALESTASHGPVDGVDSEAEFGEDDRYGDQPELDDSSEVGDDSVESAVADYDETDPDGILVADGYQVVGPHDEVADDSDEAEELSDQAEELDAEGDGPGAEDGRARASSLEGESLDAAFDAVIGGGFDDHSTPADARSDSSSADRSEPSVRGFHLGELSSPQVTESGPSTATETETYGESPVIDVGRKKEVDESDGERVADDASVDRTLRPLLIVALAVAVVGAGILAFLALSADNSSGQFDVDAALAGVGEGSLNEAYESSTGVEIYYPDGVTGEERRWVIQVVEPVTDGTGELVAAGATPPDADHMLARTKVRVTYNDGPAPGDSSDLQLRAIGPSLEFFEGNGECGATADMLELVATLNTGEALEGDLCWQIPESDFGDLKLAVGADQVVGLVFVKLG